MQCYTAALWLAAALMGGCALAASPEELLLDPLRERVLDPLCEHVFNPRREHVFRTLYAVPSIQRAVLAGSRTPIPANGERTSSHQQNAIRTRRCAAAIFDSIEAGHAAAPSVALNAFSFTPQQVIQEALTLLPGSQRPSLGLLTLALEYFSLAILEATLAGKSGSVDLFIVTLAHRAADRFGKEPFPLEALTVDGGLAAYDLIGAMGQHGTDGVVFAYIRGLPEGFAREDADIALLEEAFSTSSRWDFFVSARGERSQGAMEAELVQDSFSGVHTLIYRRRPQPSRD